MIFSQLPEQERIEIINKVTENLINLNSQSLYHFCFDSDFYVDTTSFETLAYNLNADNYDAGATKLVLFYDDIPDYVIKLPIFGYYDEWNDKYFEFQKSNCYCPIEENNNYCAAECYYTELAYQYKLEDMFIKTEVLTKIHGIPVYISERIDCINEPWENEYLCEDDAVIYSAQNLYHQYKNGLDKSKFYLENLILFIDYYGLKRTNQLIDFILQNNIQDLHNANIGFDFNGDLKIIDCAGFFD